MNRGAGMLRVIGAVSVAVLLVAIALAVGLRIGSPGVTGAAALLPDKPVAGIRLPEFALATQDDKPYSRKNLQGDITIVDFMFTRCPFICPLLTAKMKHMTERLQGTGVRFLSVSVDPERDTPAALREYASAYGADLTRWTFATGDWATVKSIVTDSLGFNLEEDPKTTIPLPGGGTMNNISHPGAFSLIGPDGELLGIYSAKDDPQVQRLIDRARLADQELARRRARGR